MSSKRLSSITHKIAIKMRLRAMRLLSESILSKSFLGQRSADWIFNKQFLCSSLISFRCGLISPGTVSGFVLNPPEDRHTANVYSSRCGF